MHHEVLSILNLISGKTVYLLLWHGQHVLEFVPCQTLPNARRDWCPATIYGRISLQLGMLSSLQQGIRVH